MESKGPRFFFRGSLNLKAIKTLPQNSKDLDLDLRELAGNLTWQEPDDMSQVISYVRRPQKGWVVVFVDICYFHPEALGK